MTAVLILGGAGAFLLGVSICGMCKHWEEAKADWKTWRSKQ